MSAPGLDSTRVAAAIGAGAETKGGAHVWIPISRLHELGRIHGGPDWRAGCDAMIGYATSKGWVDEERRRVRAHID